MTVGRMIGVPYFSLQCHDYRMFFLKWINDLVQVSAGVSLEAPPATAGHSCEHRTSLAAQLRGLIFRVCLGP